MRFAGKKKLYFAAPLFSDMERQFNKELAAKLEQFFNVFLPQEDGGLMADMIREGVKPDTAATRVFQVDIGALNSCDAFLIVLDGRTVDEGAAFELGYAFAMGKPCYGLQTDVRRLLSTGNNPMIDRALCEVFQDTAGLMLWAERFVADNVRFASRAATVTVQ